MQTTLPEKVEMLAYAFGTTWVMFGAIALVWSWLL
jgi:hypothetical protein